MLILGLLPVLLGAPADREARRVDGVLRWADTGDEVALFGVNYYTPFVFDYANLRELGLDHRRVIDQDLAHLRRMGLDLLRLHVFDREISDAAGNLVANEHLALLDHLLAQAKALGFYTVLTPIAWWPTPGDIGGFSSRYSMAQMCTDPAAREAQRRYLAQFVEHVNPLTGLAYGRDPAILLFELINEPIPPPGTTDAQVAEYIGALAGAIRDTGCTKPIVYNCWGDRLAAVRDSGIDGATFGWYPSGLASGAMLPDNYLGLVNDYPLMRDARLEGRIKGVYEFDAADIHEPYLYPAMARAFRGGGAQFAAQFQYDPWPLARTNAGWQTHYLNLCATPGKAVSFLIAAEAFRRLPRLRTHAEPPGPDRFGEFRVSYAERLSELVTESWFCHANSTSTRPPAPERLERVIGVGSSPVARYDGTGAYFLERQGPGVWRLEVYPDVVLVDDPYGPVKLEREVTRVLWAERRLALALPDLGQGFTAEPVNEGNEHRPAVRGAELSVRPGVYRLVRAGVRAEPAQREPWFATPPVEGLPERLWHRPEDALIAGSASTLRVTCTNDASRLYACLRDGEGWRRIPLERAAAYAFEVAVPPALLAGERPLEYAFAQELPDGTVVGHPSGLPGWPDERRATPPQVLLDAARLAAPPELTANGVVDGPRRCELVGGSLEAVVPGFPPEADGVAAIRVPLAEPAPRDRWEIRLRLRALTPGTHSVEVGFVQADGNAFGVNVPLSADWATVTVRPEMVRPLWHTPWTARPELSRFRELSLVWGTWLFGRSSRGPHGVAVQRVEVADASDVYRVPVEPVGPPVPLLRAAAVARRRVDKVGGSVSVVEGPGGAPVLEVRHTGFGPEPDAMGVQGSIVLTPERREAMQLGNLVRLRARALTPATTRLELILFEEDGTPWGTTAIELRPEWRTIVVPRARFELFRHYGVPPGRGGDDDSPRSESLVRWQLTFGAWLNPARAGEPQGYQIEALELFQAP